MDKALSKWMGVAFTAAVIGALVFKGLYPEIKSIFTDVQTYIQAQH